MTTTERTMPLGGDEAAEQRSAPNLDAGVVGDLVDRQMTRAVLTAKERLERGCRLDPDTGCLLWTGTRNRQGYGAINIAGKTQRAHRVAYAEANGEIPAGLLVCHHCDTPACCNPDHLFLGSHSDNMVDMMRKGRGNKPAGEAHGLAELKADQVTDIVRRLAAGEGVGEIAEIYGVSRSTISLIKSGRNWASVSGLTRETASRKPDLPVSDRQGDLVDQLKAIRINHQRLATYNKSNDRIDRAVFHRDAALTIRDAELALAKYATHQSGKADQ